MKKTFLFLIAFSHLLASNLLEKPARDWLEAIYLPSLSGRILSIGVGSYTTHYPSLTKSQESFFTLDYDPEKSLFGSPSGHYEEDFLLFESAKPFDHITMFGIMGHPPTVTTSIYTLIDIESIREAIWHADALLKVGGTLLLGPNHRDFEGQDDAFWSEIFKMEPLNHYQMIYEAIGPDNMIWWGKKQ